ncbi:1,2-dihydroxy-3-keto-5-methylthiopentene dioxygenase [Aureliella helgolandensis]|uniref:Acireductone dioxygenase n=1 Tax=Aureliella helgolandensis TaxID=2527968 RepID=A0A518GFS0_9BACT|nr:acireductone dioxygenase [Aureliella helgolandensis]QDV27407.1 Acireductone dioxygenase [Aureliella helgolandensis]
MARVIIQDENRTITDIPEIRSFLEPFGIWYENWPVEERLQADATNEEILAEFAPEIESLKQRGAFVTADVINVNRDTPNLDAMLAKFDKEHTHSEDEVRFTVAGRGLFHIHPENGPVFAVEVSSGDLINVPCGMKHWFNLCDERAIRCIRLFEDMSGWTPEYIEEGVHSKYQPLCFGPNYVPSDVSIEPNIKL